MVDVGLGDGIRRSEDRVWPGYQGGGSPEHVPVGELRLWQVGLTPPAGLTGLSVTPTSVRVVVPGVGHGEGVGDALAGRS